MHLYQEVKEVVSRLLESVVIIESRSSCAAHLELVNREDKTTGYEIWLNAAITCHSYILHSIEESLTVLGKTQFFSILDLGSGYW